MTYTFGLDTFGDSNSDADGTPLSHAQTIRNVVAEGIFAEQSGVEFFGIGEHHTDYFPMPAGDAGDDPVSVAAIAGLVDRVGYEPVRLGSLRAGRVLEPGGPMFGTVLTMPEFEKAVRADARSLT